MNPIVEGLLECPDELFEFFEQVFLFGSSVDLVAPNDIDILLIYRRDRLAEVSLQKARLEIALTQILGDLVFHFTALNQAELQQTKFSSQVRHIRVK